MTIENQMHSTWLAHAYDAEYGCVCTEAEEYLQKNNLLSSLLSW